MPIEFHVSQGDALAFGADVLALKFAQSSYGLDLSVARRLVRNGIDIMLQLPPIGRHLFVEGRGAVTASEVLFIGVEPLGRFDYLAIRRFSRSALAVLGRERPDVEHLALTLHGVGFGLDENEAFRSEVAGIVDAVAQNDMPKSLKRITIVERDPQTVARLSALLDGILPLGTLETRHIPASGAAPLADIRATLGAAGRESKNKPHIFVAMPFADEYSDRYHYGIVGAANAAGFLCERADLASFTGDVVAWVKDRISTAALVVADLTGANPNVYLEVGYAWGRGVRTVLIAPVGDELKFDVRTQRCIVFGSIRHLEEQLTSELKQLGAAT